MFYTYHQNNSGGQFIVDDELTVNVIVEAKNADDANERAMNFGIYFYGCDKGWDCPCCGDRWSKVYASEGTPEPTIYGRPIANRYKEMSSGWFPGVWVDRGQPDVIVYYLDGTVEKHYPPEEAFTQGKKGMR